VRSVSAPAVARTRSNSWASASVAACAPLVSAAPTSRVLASTSRSEFSTRSVKARVVRSISSDLASTRPSKVASASWRSPSAEPIRCSTASSVVVDSDSARNRSPMVWDNDRPRASRASAKPDASRSASVETPFRAST